MKIFLLFFLTVNILTCSVFAEVTTQSDFIRIPIEVDIRDFSSIKEMQINIFTKSFHSYENGGVFTCIVKSVNGVALDDYPVDEVEQNTYKPDTHTVTNNNEKLLTLIGVNKTIFYEDGFAIITDAENSNSRLYHSFLIDENYKFIDPSDINTWNYISRIGKGIYKKSIITSAGKKDYGIIFASDGSILQGEICVATEFTNGSAIIDNELWIDKREVPILYNGNFLKTDEVARLVNGQTMVPVRALSEALGFDVSWDENTQTVKVSQNTKDFSMRIDSTIAIIDNKMITLQIAPYVHHERTFVPLRILSETLGFEVEWLQEWNMVRLIK